MSLLYSIVNGGRFFLVAGPCAIESRDTAMLTAEKLTEICERLNISLLYKSSFDKANRTSASSQRGVGMDAGLKVLQEVRDTFRVPIVTDVHESWQCRPVAEVADVLQIPAFLSRQTDLLLAAADTGRTVNVKKGQFMAPWDMRGVVEKVRGVQERLGLSDVEHHLWLTERGSSFGYGNLVVDMTSLVEMRQFGCPVVFDATHSVQRPSSATGVTGGQRDMVPPLMRAALAVGVDGLFLEVHPDPDNAISDAANQVRLADIEHILLQALAIDSAVKGYDIQTTTNQKHLFTFDIPQHREPDTIKIKLLLTDVDGVMTDGGMYYGNSGDELKRFNAKDGMGLQLLQKSGVKVGILTSETTSLLERRARKLGLDYLVQGKRDGGKLEAAKAICAEEGLTLQEVAYIGDDVNCRDLLSEVGFAACPADAVSEIRSVSGIHVLSRRGGDGCLRELCEMLITKNK